MKFGVTQQSVRWSLAYSVLLGFVILTTLSFFDVSWWPRDEGVFAHLAERVAAGEVYGVDVHDFHGGYHTFLNAWLFERFGFDLVVLRYPLILLTVLQAGLVAFLLRRVSLRISLLGGVASMVFGFLMFPNPSPNWYALFFAVLTIVTLTELRPSRQRSVLLGILLGVCALFRHPSAVFLGFGVLLAILYERRTEEHTPQVLPRLLIGALLLAVVVYSGLFFSLLPFVLYALPLLGIALALFVQYRFVIRAVGEDLLFLGAGVFLAFLPMLVYQLRVGDVWVWFERSFLTSAGVVDRLPFHLYSYQDVFLTYVYDALAKDAWPLALVQIGFWATLFLLPLVVGWMGWRQVVKQEQGVHPAVFIAVAYGLVSFYYEISFYFFTSLLLFLIALSVSLPARKTVQDIWFSILLVLVVFGCVSLLHGYDALVQPQEYRALELDRATLRLPADEAILHEKLVAEIVQYTTADDVIFVMPFDAELYFLSDRRNAFASLGTTFEVSDTLDQEVFHQELEGVAPRLVVQNTNSVLHSAFEAELTQWFLDHGYTEVSNISGYRFLLRNEDV